MLGVSEYSDVRIDFVKPSSAAFTSLYGCLRVQVQRPWLCPSSNEICRCTAWKVHRTQSIRGKPSSNSPHYGFWVRPDEMSSVLRSFQEPTLRIRISFMAKNQFVRTADVSMQSKLPARSEYGMALLRILQFVSWRCFETFSYLERQCVHSLVRRHAPLRTWPVS